MNLGAPELILVVLVIILIFGAKRLPEIARSLGKAKNEFKRGLDEEEENAAKSVTAKESPQAGPASESPTDGLGK